MKKETLKHMAMPIVCMLMAATMMSCGSDEAPVPQTLLVRADITRQTPDIYKSIVFDADGVRSESEGGTESMWYYQLSDEKLTRVTYEIYRYDAATATDDAAVYARRVHYVAADATSDTAQVVLPKGDYRVLVFADAVDKQTKASAVYNTSNLKAVIASVNPYPSEIQERECFAGNASISFEESRTLAVNVAPATARLRFVTTDFADFVSSGGNISGLKAKIVYKQYIATGYDVSEMEPNQFITGYSFNPILNEYVVDVMGWEFVADYLLSHKDAETNIIADLYIYDESGREVSHFANIDIPLMRGKETIVRGCLLTHSYGDSNGMPIDENFTGEYVINVEI